MTVTVRMRFRVGGALSALALLAGPLAAERVNLPEVAPKALIEQLSRGGHVIFIRHAVTDREGADQVSAKMGDCSTQRTLSEQGWRDARAIGAAFANLGIPVAEVVSSEYCRAWQTAELAFGRHVKNPALNFEPAEDYTEAQHKAMRERVRPLLARQPPAGFNTVIIGHDDPFEAATGHYPEPQGKTIVIRPDGRGGFALVGGINPDGWWKLLADR